MPDRPNPLQPSVLLFHGLHLADQGRIHPAIFHPPLVEQRGAHPMLTAQIGNRHTAFGLPQDRDDLSLNVSACLNSTSPRSSWRENSTYAAPYLLGGLPQISALQSGLKTIFPELLNSENGPEKSERDFGLRNLLIRLGSNSPAGKFSGRVAEAFGARILAKRKSRLMCHGNMNLLGIHSVSQTT
jgi:hypothetical protein